MLEIQAIYLQFKVSHASNILSFCKEKH